MSGSFIFIFVFYFTLASFLLLHKKLLLKEVREEEEKEEEEEEEEVVAGDNEWWMVKAGPVTPLQPYNSPTRPSISRTKAEQPWDASWSSHLTKMFSSLDLFRSIPDLCSSFLSPIISKSPYSVSQKIGINV